MAFRKEIGTNDLPVLTQSANIEERNESLNPSFKHSSTTIKNGKNLVGNVTMRDIYQYDIEDVINQQGFDGPPRLVTNIDEFYHFVDKDHFIGERTFSGNSKRLVDEWYEQLKHGEFYVKCREGGFQYGRGLYCAADYTKGTIDYSKFQHEIDQYARNEKYVKTIWMTVDPSVKIIDFDDIQFEYACEWMINKYPNKVTKIDDLKRLNKQINDDISSKELLRLKNNAKT